MCKVFLSSLNGQYTIEREYETSETVNDLKMFLIDHLKNINAKKYKEMQNLKETKTNNNLKINLQEIKVTKNVKNIVCKSIQIIYNSKIVSENVLLKSLSDGDLNMKFAFNDVNTYKNVTEECKNNDNKEIIDVFENIKITNSGEKEMKRSSLNENEVEMKKIENMIYVKTIKNGEKMLIDPTKIITINKQFIYVTKREKVKSVFEDFRLAVANLKVELIVKLALVFALFLSGNYEFGAIMCAILSLKMLTNIKFKLRMKDKNRFCMNIFYSFFITLLLYHSDQILDYTEDKSK